MVDLDALRLRFKDSKKGASFSETKESYNNNNYDSQIQFLDEIDLRKTDLTSTKLGYIKMDRSKFRILSEIIGALLSRVC